MLRVSSFEMMSTKNDKADVALCTFVHSHDNAFTIIINCKCMLSYVFFKNLSRDGYFFFLSAVAIFCCFSQNQTMNEQTKSSFMFRKD